MKIKIVIEPTFSKKWPNLDIHINDEKYFTGECRPNTDKHFIYEADIDKPKDQNILKITHRDKHGNDTVVDKEENIVSDRAIILKSLEFDSLKVPEVILYESKFYPNWPGQPEYTTNNLYFGFNGTFEFLFSSDTQRMYFTHLLQKEMIANTNNKKEIQLPNGQVMETFEFNGKQVGGDEKETVTIEDLYQRVVNEG